MEKRFELSNEKSCLNKAAPTEPIFVLRAHDPLAAQAVRLWAAMASGVHEDSKIQEATILAAEMDSWLSAQPPEPRPALAPQTSLRK